MDHRRVDISDSNFSCGVGTLARVSDEVADALYMVATHLYHPARGRPKAFLVFSNVADRETNSKALVDLVHKHGFGKVSCSESTINPNTGNPIVVWTWLIHHEAFKKWWQEQRVTRLVK